MILLTLLFVIIICTIMIIFQYKNMKKQKNLDRLASSWIRNTNQSKMSSFCFVFLFRMKDIIFFALFFLASKYLYCILFLCYIHLIFFLLYLSFHHFFIVGKSRINKRRRGKEGIFMNMIGCFLFFIKTQFF